VQRPLRLRLPEQWLGVRGERREALGVGFRDWNLGTVMHVRAATIHLCSQLIVKHHDSWIKR
jgi:hypothetical protein